MGHKRYGYLPKSDVWRAIVSEMSAFSSISNNSKTVATNTLKQVINRFAAFEKDPSIQSSFENLLKFSFAFQKDDPITYLNQQNLLPGKKLSLMQIIRAVNKIKHPEINSLENQTFADQAVIDAINTWYLHNLERGNTLFNEEVDVKAIFNKASTGSGFCELSRLFFSKFTERYLKYFLEREASAVITGLQERIKFNEAIRKYINKISTHAFETAKITESYSAGWYNKNTKNTYPAEKEIKGILSYAFTKMKSELLEEEKK